MTVWEWVIWGCLRVGHWRVFEIGLVKGVWDWISEGVWGWVIEGCLVRCLADLMMRLTSVGNYTSMLIKMLIGLVLQMFLDDIVGSHLSFCHYLGSFVLPEYSGPGFAGWFGARRMQFWSSLCKVFNQFLLCFSMYMRVHLKTLNNFFLCFGMV